MNGNIYVEEKIDGQQRGKKTTQSQMAVRKQLADAINPQDQGEFRMYRSVMKILHLMNHPFVRSIKD